MDSSTYVPLKQRSEYNFCIPSSNTFLYRRCIFWKIHYHFCKFKVCKSVHHHTFQINQPTRCNNFSSLLLDVYVQLNMFRASSRLSSGAQQLQYQPLVLPLERGGSSAIGRGRAPSWLIYLNWKAVHVHATKALGVKSIVPQVNNLGSTVRS